MCVLCTCNNALFRCKDVSFNSRRDNGHIKGGRRPSNVLRRSSFCEMALGRREGLSFWQSMIKKIGRYYPNCAPPLEKDVFDAKCDV